MSPARTSLRYGRYDLVATAPTEAWARAWGVTRLHPYDRGHAHALFNRQMYEDYARLLDEDHHALNR